MLAVREIVETLGPVDGRYYARLIGSWDAKTLASPEFLRIDSWGDPLRWPGTLLGTPSACSPTSLRYLAHALWLKREGLVRENGRIVEIGVGYGGLTAMNAWLSGASTHPVDLPEVSAAAGKMLKQTGFPEATVIDSPSEDYCFISNYAFTELSGDLQENYFDRYLRASTCGVIVSNANVFAKQIGGRNDADLLQWFRKEGLNARIDESSPIICPSDKYHKVSVIRW
jgi:hypothetical protein